MNQVYTPENELRLYKAKIYDVGKNGDDRLQVRIIPHMADFDDSELENLPRYPCIFKGQTVMGLSEVQDGVDKAEFVLVAASEDFTYGYVIGKLNKFYTCGNGSFQESYGYDFFKNYISSRGLDVTNVEYEDIQIQYWCSTDDGGYIDALNYKTGDKYIINSSGTCIIMQQNKIYIRVGSPNGTAKNSEKMPFSVIEMTPAQISIKSKTLDVDCDDIILGHHNMNLLGTASAVSVACEGMNLMPVSNIWV